MPIDGIVLSPNTQTQAGTYAKQRFQRGARAWRRRVLRTSQVALVAGAASSWIGALMTSNGSLKIVLAFSSGTLVSMLVVVRDLVPPHIEMWRRGWEGERRTAKALRRLLTHDWEAVHDIDLPEAQSNIDHALVGPAGVFLLDTKWYAGHAHLDQDVLRLTFPDDPLERPRDRRLGPRMRGAAADLRDRIHMATGERLWVHAVVVLWTPFDQGIVEHESVTYVHGSKLAEWLASRPDASKQFRRDDVLEALRSIGGSLAAA